MSVTSLVFDPAFGWQVLAALALLSAALLVLAAWRGLAGWLLRALAAFALLGTLAGPSLQREERAARGDILLALVDETASQGLSDRSSQSARALEALKAQAEARGLELEVARLGDGENDSGTQLVTRLGEAIADLPRDRLAGVFVISDGQAHDGERAASLDIGAPLHLLLTGHGTDWDRRLVITSAPAFAILGEEQVIRLRIEDMGAPPEPGARSFITISAGGGPAIRHEVPVGRDLELPVVLDHGGMNVIRLEVPVAPGELTGTNNAAIVQISGVRDRLRVLLVSGQPHPGTRTWRNLLKSDASVDLVHFTILRPPDKQDGVPVSELSLIAFPTQELFLDKIDEFDLIIFDRYKLRGILPGLYLDNVRAYVEAGGAVLVAAGPDFASAESLARSPLGEVLPGAPTGQVLEQRFVPELTEKGARHPVTAGLRAQAPEGGWGPWMRQVELVERSGHTLMTGVDGLPLLMLDRVGEGRVALIASDHAWLWSRGIEGGGPQLELLRRLAHWMMKEPELEEESLSGIAEGDRLIVTRTTMEDGPGGEVVLTRPDGTQQVLELAAERPGLWQGETGAGELGLYRLSQGALRAVVAVGPSAPREFERTIADGAPLKDLTEATGGGVWPIETGLANLRPVRAGRPAAGRGWLGYTPRAAYVSRDIRLIPLAPPWLMLLLAAGLALAAWLIEGRRLR